MPSISKHNIKRPWIKSNIRDNQRQTIEDNKLYHTTQWRALRDDILRTEPLCRECKKQGRVKAATTVDHIIQVRKGGKMFDRNNLQPLCDSCHASKSGKEAH